MAEASGKREFSINTQTKKIVNRSARNIWNNTVKMLCSDKEYEMIFNHDNLDQLYHLLDKLYITDMCHFAPQGDVELLKQLSWTGKYGIRSKVANYFMHQEIKLINPKLLIASGGEVIKATKQLFVEGEVWGLKPQNLPNLYKMTSNAEEFHLLQIPHIGTLMPRPYSFWREHIDSLNKVLQESGVL
ncbi:MAG: hypothetical protein IPM82_10750 [Saprospiraceae bacterium]|nr:hypothetical protein [Saprospiraceae bacterium]